MYLLSIFTTIEDILRSLMLTLCNLVYRLIYFTFAIFEKLGSARIINDVSEIAEKVGLLIGLFMAFRLVFAFVQYIVEPDIMFDKQKGAINIVKKIIISIVLLGSISSLFNLAYRTQKIIIDSKVISKIFFGSPSNDTSSFGARLSAELFASFYRVNNSIENFSDYQESLCVTMINAPTNDDGIVENEESKLIEKIKKNKGSLYGYKNAYAALCLNEKVGELYVVDFDGDGFIALVAGILVLYTVIIFTIQVGIRAIQLLYLEIIAPIPIIMYITPKGDDYLKKFGQQCLTTFLDFFLRTAIIYFAVYLIQTIWSTGFVGKFLSAGTESNSGWETAYIGAIMIIAVLIFAKKVPKLLQEIFPSMGGAAGFSYSLKMPDEAKQFGRTVRATTGTAIGAVAGGVTGLVHGKGTFSGRAGNAFTGVFRGAKAGATTKGNIFGNVKKGVVSQRMASQKAYERNQDGSTFFGRTAIGATHAAHRLADYEKELESYKEYDAQVAIIDKELEKNAYVQSAMAKKQALLDSAAKRGRAPSAADIKRADDLIEKAKKTILEVEMGTGKNTTLMNAIKAADAIREQGVDNGYSGFNGISLVTGALAARRDAFFDNKKSARQETFEVTGAGGARNADYKQVKANSKYQPKGS